MDMKTETGFPASGAGTLTTPSFGTASVRLFAPQYMFEIVRAQASAVLGRAGSGDSDAAPKAANENEPGPRSSAA
jgi:hypothetical protein